MKGRPPIGWWSKRVGWQGSQMRPAKAETLWGAVRHKPTLIRLPRKSSKRDSSPTVPQTDTGRWGEYPKVLERTVVKELGKLPP